MIIGFVMFKIIVKFIIVPKDAYARRISLSPVFIGIAPFCGGLVFSVQDPAGQKLGN